MTQKTNFTVVAAVVNTMSLTLFDPEGETYIIPQSDPRSEGIIAVLLPILNDGKTYTLDLTKTDPFEQMVKESKGIVQFFRVARKSIANLFGRETSVTNYDAANNIISLEDMTNKVAEIRANMNVINTNLNTENMNSDDTIVAIVDDKIIPDMEKLSNIINHNMNTNNYKGTEKLIKRLSNVINNRQHSVKDALEFIAKSDLEIATDGSIIGYKILNKTDKQNNLPTYVDCHSRTIHQHVGSRVFMAPSLVDPNRRNECSHGLHVARRGYIRSFSGDVCVLVKINPEDIIAVPHGDSDKVRVAAYSILAELPHEAKTLLQQDRPITSIRECSSLLAQALNGTLENEIHSVEILSNARGDVRHSYTGKKTSVKKPVDKNITAKAIDDDSSTEKSKATSILEISKKIKDFRTMSNVEKVQSLFEVMGRSTTSQIKDLAKEILIIKRKTKKPWSHFNINSDDGSRIQELAVGVTINNNPIKPPTAKLKPASRPAKAETVKAKPQRAKPAAGGAEVSAEVYKAMTNAQKAQYLYVNDEIEALWELKRRAKVSWDKLGVPEPDKK